MNMVRKKPLKQYKYLTFLIMLFITIFIICDITAFRMVPYFGKEIPLSGFIIPFLFALGDILAETYGYRITMRILLSSILCQCLFGALISLALLSPSPSDYPINQAYSFAFQHIIRTNITSCFSVTSGMLANAFLISKLKVYMNGKKFWVRTLVCSSFSEIILCTVAYFILFSGLRSVLDIITVIWCVWSYKVIFSILITPFTSIIGKFLKHIENSDVYDTHINYNPLKHCSDYIIELEGIENYTDKKYHQDSEEVAMKNYHGKSSIQLNNENTVHFLNCSNDDVMTC